MVLAAAYIDLVLLHGASGQRLWINPPEITSLREPNPADRIYFVKGAHCVVVMADGKFIATRETCDEIRHIITEQHQKQ